MPSGTKGITFVTKRCKECNAEFSVQKGTEKYKHTCSKKCRVAAGAKTRSTGRTIITRPCPECGTEFSVIKGAEKNKQYCSQACGHKARAAKLTTRETRTCPVCAGTFVVIASSKQKTCSTACAGKHKRTRHGYYTDDRRTVDAHYAAAYRAAKRRAVPAWADMEKVAAMYEEARRLTDETGVEHNVDHIVPLTSRKVADLHWEGNLRITTKLENAAKGNRHWPDMP